MQTKTVPNEILIRYDDSGVFQGAHVTLLTLVLADDGVTVIARQRGDTQQLTPQSSPTFAATLGQALNDALVQNDALKAQIAALQAAPPPGV